MKTGFSLVDGVRGSFGTSYSGSSPIAVPEEADHVGEAPQPELAVNRVFAADMTVADVHEQLVIETLFGLVVQAPCALRW